MSLRFDADPWIFGTVIISDLCFYLASVLVLSFNYDQPCDRPLIAFLLGAVILWSVSIPTSVSRFCTARAGQVPTRARVLLQAYSMLYTVWLILGTIWWFGSDTCKATNIHVYRMAQALLIAGYTAVGATLLGGSVFDFLRSLHG